jgi:hypothetical protein
MPSTSSRLGAPREVHALIARVAVKSGLSGAPAGRRRADCWLVIDSHVPWKS